MAEFSIARKANFVNCVASSLLAIFILLTSNQVSGEVTKLEKRELKMKVTEMFNHAYSSYMHYAYPADELMPLSCKGRYRGSEPDRGDIDETLGNFSLTLIDTLDTLAVFGNISEFDRAVRLVIQNVKFDTDVVVSVFETNIRVLGGLLGAHVVADVFKKQDNGLHWYKGELLNMAVDVADRLLLAFNTTTGIPYPRINLMYGVHHPKSRIVDESDTCTACAGTMIMEFAALSRLTGDPKYEKKAHSAMDAIWHYRSRNSDLVGTVINIHNGDWIRRDSGIGAGIDSYYEYCFKAYILLGDKSYLEKFNKHYAAINKYVKQGVMMLDVLMHQPERPIRAFVDALQAFWPGLQVLMGDLKPAIETHEMLYEVVRRHKFIPEAFTTNYDVYWAQHPLRPEFAESTYFLYEATKDPYYLEAGKHIVETLELHARVPCGFAAIQDLRTFTHEDKMDSFVLAETFKYLYLLFSEESDRILNVHNFVFTTEAHLLPLSLSNVNFDAKNNNTVQNATRQATIATVTDDRQSTCPNNAVNKFSLKEFARIIRKEYRRPQQVPKCSSDSPDQKFKEVYLNADPNREPKLRADQFQVGNDVHLQLLKDMGITVVQTNDGKVQLMHQAGMASTPEDATDGIKFMQDMIQIAKTRTQDPGSLHKPRVVQIVSPPYDGTIHFGAGAAQFGLDISNKIGVIGEVVESIPYSACSEITNQDEFQNRIVIAQRGGCMFIDKVRRAQKHGALGVIIVDHNEGTTADAQPVFAMSGDSHSEDVSIPSVFLFRKEGDILRTFAQESKEKYGRFLSVKLAGKITEPDNNSEHAASSDPESSKTAVNSPKEGEPSNVHIVSSSEDSTISVSDPSKKFDIGQCKHTPETSAKAAAAEIEETKPEGAISAVEGEEDEIIKRSTETHVERNSDGKLVSYETTYTTYVDKASGETTSKIQVVTKPLPFESNSLEIDRQSLEKVKDGKDGRTLEDAKDSESCSDSSKNEIKVEDLSETEGLMRTLNDAVKKDKVNQIGQDIKTVDDLEGKDAERQQMEGRSEDVHKDDGQIKSSDTLESEHSINDSAERNVESTPNKKDKLEKDKTIENISNDDVSKGQTTEQNSEKHSTEQESASQNQPKNIICNSFGCFSSLEELNMFQGLAEQVRSNLQQMEAAEEASNVESNSQNGDRPKEIPSQNEMPAEQPSQNTVRPTEPHSQNTNRNEENKSLPDSR